MIQYRLDYTIEKALEAQLTKEQKAIRQLTGKVVPKSEADTVWKKILDHKWYVSENLRRDVGLRVAAVDYLENIYNRKQKPNNDYSDTFRRAMRAFTIAA